MFNKISKNLRAVVALPFVIVAMGLLLLYWFFIYHGEWKWNVILEEIYDDLWRL
ncbi:hypothetical protein [Rodentibacter pneumotropicus]|uniref:hypothetical protein n=1 Tax=Rodentibacter pneumotropicus TaxID=758 RepID=UPI001863B2FE|nr:hypothetical protein [Rodentibacter pneumotropicus]